MAALPAASSHTSRDRRKKPVVTYGRPARNPTFSATSAKSFYDDSRSAASPSKLKRPATNPAKKAKVADDEFDIPISDDDDTVSPPPRSQKYSKTRAKAGSEVVVDNGRIDGETDMASPCKRQRTTPDAMKLSKGHQDAKLLKVRQDDLKVGQDVSVSLHPRRSRKQGAIGALDPATPQVQPGGRAVKAAGLLAKSTCPLSPAAASPTSPADSISSISTTPKQKRLWHELLLSDPVEVEVQASQPSTLCRSPNRASPQPSMSSFHPHITPVSASHKLRIVDRLKEKAVSNVSDEESSDNEEKTEKTPWEEPASLKLHPAPAQVSLQQPAQYSQSQSRLPAQQSSASQGATKVTYARSRTYLQDSLEDMIFGDLPMVAPERPVASARRTKAAPAARAKSKANRDDDSDEENSQNIRSIHDLRAAGHKSRFLDDATRLVDDIKNPKPSSRSQRRIALMELCETLTDDGFASRFIEHGFDASIIDQFRYTSMDVLADMLLCVVLMRIAQASPSLLQGGVLDFFCSYLGDTKDIGQIARERKNNMSKVAQSDYLVFMEKIRTADIWGGCSPDYLSPCSLALLSIDCIFVTHRRNKNSGGILSSSIASRLVSLATSEAHGSEKISQAMSNRALSALEAATTLDVESASSAIWSTETLSQVTSALPVLLNSPDHSKGLTLRFCCSVTNDNEDNSGVFCEPDTIHLIMSLVIEGFHSRKMAAGSDHDLLVLALGLMINLTSVSEVARQRAAHAEHDGLAALVNIFVTGQKKAAESQSEEEMQANIPYGWLSVLLGYICLDSNARERVFSLLPGKSGSVLLDAVEGIALMSQQVDSQAAEEKEDMSSGFTQKLLSLVARLRNVA